MKRLNRKLKSKKGETLAETLVSVLIISISSVALAVMIRSAGLINERAKQYDKDLSTAINTMLSSDVTVDGVARISDGGESSSTKNINITMRVPKLEDNRTIDLYCYTAK